MADDDTNSLDEELLKKYDPERMLQLVSKRAGKGEALDHSIRAKYEKRFGVDLGHVRIITGEFAEEFNKKRDAYAVTIGSTGMILMGGSPEKSMGSTSGQALLAHELTHVAQAHRGVHRKASFDGGMPFGEEHEAQAEQVEHEELATGAGSPTRQASDANAAKAAAGDKLKEALEKVRERVFEMATDAARSFMQRNGVQRRP